MRCERADRDYRRARHRRKIRGEAKAELVEERSSACEKIGADEKQLEATLEAARRAGVPPGWVREGLAGSEE